MPSSKKSRKAASRARKRNNKSSSSGVVSAATPVSSDDGSLDESKKYRAYIECDACGQRGPSQKCSRCKCAFYCSVECQRQHWIQEHKEKCIPIKKRVEPIPPVDDSLVIPLNSECGICLDDPIEHPVVLPGCRHAFCLSCMSNWQVECKPNPGNLGRRLRGQSIYKFCPMCRTTIGTSVARDALDKANAYQNQACRIPRNASNDKERIDLLSKAVSVCDKVLEGDANDLDALEIKARALVQFNPSETVTIVKQLLELHKEMHPKYSRFCEKTKKMFATMEAGNVALGLSLEREMNQYYSVVEPWPRKSLGDEPGTVFEMRTFLAKSHEDLHQTHDAYLEYKDMMDWYEAHEGTNTPSEEDLRRQHEVTSGFSRCMLEYGELDEALKSSQHALLMDRHAPGIHILVANAQRALARNPRSIGALTGRTNAISCTMSDAVETMYRAVVYETPWDEDNQQANRKFLQGLLNEIADENP
jgi:ribosomal protein L44E